MVKIIDTEFAIERAFEKGIQEINFKTFNDFKRVAIKLKIPFIFKCKGSTDIENFYFFHQGILYRYYKLKHRID